MHIMGMQGIYGGLVYRINSKNYFVQELKIIINQLREEVDEKNSSVKVQQLQKENKDLQQLVNKYKEKKHIDKEVNEVETVSTSTQTDEVASVATYNKYMY